VLTNFSIPLQHHISLRSIHRFLSLYRKTGRQAGSEGERHISGDKFYNFHIVNMVTKQAGGFHVFTAVDLKIMVSWDVMLCSLVGRWN
jgi:hypothetical protein